MNTKIITTVLPQFYRNEDNDRWWGEGFTEWTGVRNAKREFRGQIQPKIPLNKNYYDLTDRSTVEWQTDLMHKYGVYGFCYFHYWFCGRKLLNKPTENLLKWKDIDQNFCFFWANNTWARTWSAVESHTDWVVSDKNPGNHNDGILVEQTYGEPEDWKTHYEYLREFFKDPRYIKKDNKPIFFIYYISDIECFDEMMDLWDGLAKSDGFDGIHIVSVNEIHDNPRIDAVVQYANYGNYVSQSRYFIKSAVDKLCSAFGIRYIYPRVFDYRKIWKGIVDKKYPENMKVYPGGLVRYDETPRRGRNALYLKGDSPEIFEWYLRKQIVKRGAEYLLLDAWNEWGEGNYLEPDEENGFGYLEALKRVVDSL